MKKVLLVLTILAFAIAILCGCNHKSDEINPTSDISDSTVEITQSNDSSNSTDAQTDKQSDCVDEENNSNSDKATHESNKNTDNSTKKSQNEDVKSKENDDSKSETLYKDEMHEAEIDFSELE